MLVLVVAIPLAGIVVYVMNQNGFFNAASNAPASVAPQQQSAPPSQSPATVTLDNPRSLPQKVAVGEIVPFSFTVENSGNTVATYPYKVYVKWNSGEQDVIDENPITLAGSGSAVIHEFLKFETAPATAEVFIEKTQPEQTIHFTLPRAK